jgi:chromosome partitioning protein
LITKDAVLENAVLSTDFEMVDVIPADSNSKSSDIMLEEMKGNKNRLKGILKQLDKEYEFVFIDCPPGFSALSENIFNAADIVLMPVIPTTLSVRTYHMVKDYFKEKELDVKKMMCFFTMADLRKNLHNEVMEELFKDKRFFQNYIPYLSDVEKMGTHQQPLFEFANSSYAAQCYRDLWNEIKKTCLSH